MVPAEVATLIQEIPKDFTVPYSIDKTGRVLKWSGSIPDADETSAQRIKIELGALRTGDVAADEKALYAEVWKVMELARLGRHDLLNHVRADRHKVGRPVSTPQIVPPASEPQV